MSTPVVVSRIQNRRGTQAQFDALYPTYPGSGPNVLQPGEIALCTDTNRIFVGTVNIASETGYYTELATASSPSSLTFLPQRIDLPPASAWSPIPALDHSATPFYSILYGITDAPQVPLGNPAPANAVGVNFAKNGELKITAIAIPMTMLPLPVTLTDTGTEINNAPPVPNMPTLIPPTVIPDISFRADYNGGNIRISYIHNFPSNLTFSTSSVYWLSL